MPEEGTIIELVGHRRFAQRIRLLRRLTGENRHQVRKRVVADLVVALQTDPTGLAQIPLRLRHSAIKVQSADAVDAEDEHAQLPGRVPGQADVTIAHLLRIQDRVNILVHRLRLGFRLGLRLA